MKVLSLSFSKFKLQLSYPKSTADMIITFIYEKGLILERIFIFNGEFPIERGVGGSGSVGA